MTAPEPTSPVPSDLTLPLLAERINHERDARISTEQAIAANLAEAKSELQRRLGELNHAHAQMVDAAARTVPRELFDAFVKENDSRREAAFAALGARLEASIDNVKQTHRVAFDSLEDAIEVERNARIRAEGSVSVWRFIAVFLGFPGIVALILAAIALVGPDGRV